MGRQGAGAEDTGIRPTDKEAEGGGGTQERAYVQGARNVRSGQVRLTHSQNHQFPHVTGIYCVCTGATRRARHAETLPS